jgi:hypothetical protein
MQRAVETSTHLRAPIERVRAQLTDDPGKVIAGTVSPEERRKREFRATLGIDVAGTGVRHEVLIHVGAAHSTPMTCAVPLHWRASGHSRLFPTFDGQLEAFATGTGTTLTLRGTYTLPAGLIGRVGDGVVGRRLAEQSLSTFLEQAVGRIDAGVARRAGAVTWHPAPYPIDLRDVASDYYVG